MCVFVWMIFVFWSPFSYDRVCVGMFYVVVVVAIEKQQMFNFNISLIFKWVHLYVSGCWLVGWDQRIFILMIQIYLVLMTLCNLCTAKSDSWSFDFVWLFFGVFKMSCMIRSSCVHFNLSGNDVKNLKQVYRQRLLTQAHNSAIL